MGQERGVERQSGAGMSGLMEGRRLSEGEAGWMLENSSRDRMIIQADRFSCSASSWPRYFQTSHGTRDSPSPCLDLYLVLI